jgi:hypothetical protein
MSRYTLRGDYYALPTPAGAYQAVSTPTADPAKRLLLGLLAEERSVRIDGPRLAQMTGLDEQDALQLLFQLQKLALIEGYRTAPPSPSGPLELVLPKLLGQLSGDGKALLADAQGFYLACEGFPHEAAEELSALSAELSALYVRRQGLLQNNLGHTSGHWGLIDAAGNAEIGFWYLFIGNHRFTLVLSGLPQLNQSAFTQLVWCLVRRYEQQEYSAE